MLSSYKEISGKTSVNNGAPSAALVAAPGSGKQLRLVSGVINVTVAATGTGGLVAIRDGSTDILTFDANAIGSYPFAFDCNNGFPLTANTALNLVVASAVTAQATANCAIVGYVIG